MKFKVMKYGKERRTELLCKCKYKNYNYYVLNLGTHPTAYIEIPKENKLYRKSYDEIYKIGCDIDVHGGLTYSNNELMGVKSENWFIGWDYAHYGDYYGYEETMPESIRTYGKKWTTEEIIEECKNAIDQIIGFESKEILEKPNKIEKIEQALDENNKLKIQISARETLCEEYEQLINTILNFSFFKEECPLNFSFEDNSKEDEAQNIFYSDEYCENNCNDIYKDCWLKYFKELQKAKGDVKNKSK